MSIVKAWDECGAHLHSSALGNTASKSEETLQLLRDVYDSVSELAGQPGN